MTEDTTSILRRGLHDMPRRLDKFLRDATPLPRRAIQAAIWRGQVAVDQSSGGGLVEAEVEPHMLVFSDDEVRLDGVLVSPVSPSVYAIFHKPAEVLCVSSDPYGRRCLSSWLEALPKGTYPVGRLDRPTTGLLVLTDDGDLGHVLIDPRHQIEKTYQLQVEGRLEETDDRLRQLREGVLLRDGEAYVCSLTILERGDDETLIEMVIDEGRKRQIRRMCGLVHLELLHLHRVRIGPLSLGALPVGAVQRLDDAQVDELWSALGGRSRPRLGALRALERQAQRRRRLGKPHLRLERWLETIGARD